MGQQEQRMQDYSQVRGVGLYKKSGGGGGILLKVWDSQKKKGGGYNTLSVGQQEW